MRSLPPAEGRNSRLGHISIEDFAKLLGTGKQRVFDWRDGKAYPDARNRDKLAAVSAGRYQPEDFMGPAAAARATDFDGRLRSLEAEVETLKAELDLAREANETLLQRVEALAERSGAQSGPGRSGRAKRGGGQP